MSGRLAGKVALVTGAGHGIGEVIARRFAGEGARLVLADIFERRAQAVADALGDAVGVHCDVADEDQVAAAITAAGAAFGGLDILVNNAAVGSMSDIERTSTDDWNRVIAVNLTGTFHGIKHAVPALRRRGGGAIVNTSSVAGRRALPGLCAYGVSKAGVEALTRNAAVELRGDNIRVNAIVPAMVRTRAGEAAGAAIARHSSTELDGFIATSQGRWAEPDEVAGAAVHLVGDESTFTSGLLYLIDNGATGGL